MKGILLLLSSSAALRFYTAPNYVPDPNSKWVDLPPPKPFSEIRKENYVRNMEEDFELENPDLAQEVADKVINH